MRFLSRESLTFFFGGIAALRTLRVFLIALQGVYEIVKIPKLSGLAFVLQHQNPVSVAVQAKNKQLLVSYLAAWYVALVDISCAFEYALGISED